MSEELPSQGTNSPCKISFSLRFGQDRRTLDGGKKVKGHEFPNPRILQGSGVTQPSLPQGIGACSGIVQLSFAGHFA